MEENIVYSTVWNRAEEEQALATATSMIEQDAQMRCVAAWNSIQDILARAHCELDVAVTVSAGGIEPHIRVVAKPRPAVQTLVQAR